MELWECGTKTWKEAVVRPVEGRDFRYLTSREFAFPWKKWKDRADLYKLCLLDEERILGLMALEDIPGDKRIEIKLLASSKENRGAHKKLEGISGCLIAWACRLAVKKYAEEACVSLVPKTVLKPYYIKQFGMLDAGWHVFLEGRALLDLLLKYKV